MSDSRVASRYAKSLLGLAHEKGVLEEVNADMRLFAQVADANYDFVLLMKNPIVNHAKKLQVLTALFSKKVNPLTLEFFKIITRKNREEVLPGIAKEFGLQYNIFKGIVEAKVTTTFALDAASRKQFVDIIKEVTKKEVALKEAVNPDLIGGFILTIGDRQIDESVSGKLYALRRTFSENPYVKTF
ncbi:ATP synthase F1 subunit delta [Cytophagales bacterium LB-30]|uniref:ATP synthase subunit delta n=1 Tax=Shiella aurantiaca TaxID=3058365 RepID=A0ABT8F6M9_9BACT|nr:ATP synthase F1 subunit delta [Shiella aurantiaca]MDN4166137.1 ATP synthase F1 subunit delta [Shiella aurantiaca]